MVFHAQTRIGDVVLEMPATMRVFEELNVDYCCGGHRSLAEACLHAGKNLTDVVAKLEAIQASAPTSSDPKKWQDAPLEELIAHIETKHHSFTRTELARVAPLMEKVLKVHGDHHPELIRIAQCFEAMNNDLIPHLGKEEQILFPFIRNIESGRPSTDSCFGSIQNPIKAMQNEHEQAGDILRELRILTNDYTPPEDACGSYRSLFMGLKNLEEDLHLHIYLESHLLFPRAIALEKTVARIG